ncbi:MAG TPA: TRAFs-binding domain-containing protein [Pyrinomonadaceae bacterium]|nr:TRAFs-binding domain-containing protein [Pyrinomonadaceae bacterium]
MAYKPRPIDTSGITLPEEVLELTELLAKNTHEIWARQRVSEHWRYGAERNDERLEHPGLVAYEELSEVEKQYDRNTALETLKTIISLGYRIEPPAEAARADDVASPARDANAVLEILKQPGALALSDLLAIWRARDPSRWARSAEVHQQLGARLLKLGELLLAYDVLSEGLKFRPGDLRLRQLQAHALTRLGATERANALLLALYEEGQRDEETVGMLARTHKDLWQQAADPAERERQLQQSYKFYEEAYQLSGGYWTGINAATIAVLSGRREHARALAVEVRALCLADLRRMVETGGDRYWALATLGEAALVSEDWPEAARRYDEALADGRRQLGELTSTRRNARLIIEYLGGDPAFIERHLPVPKVAVFFAASDATEPQVPAAREASVRQVLLERINELGAGVGYTVVPSGGDAPFLEAMLEAGGETHAVLPCELNELLAPEDGDGRAQAERAARYESLLGRLTSVVAASEQNMTEGDMSGEYSRLLLHGLALIRAGQLDTELVPLSLPDVDSTDAAAGKPAATASAFKRPDERAAESADERSDRRPDDSMVVLMDGRTDKRLVELMDGRTDERLDKGMDERAELNEFASLTPRAPLASLDNSRMVDGTRGADVSPEARAATATGFSARMAALLFADAVNFSKLTEAQIPIFVRDFLGAVGSLVASFQPAPLLKNTWGDGLYLVFADVEIAGRFALDLSDLLNATDWTRQGLPADLNLRIALHAGPVYACTDPVTDKLNFIGTHVSRAARLEPITPPGQVYASQAFAALAAAARVRGFTCDYVGQTPLAKKYGTFPTYHVRRQR